MKIQLRQRVPSSWHPLFAGTGSPYAHTSMGTKPVHPTKIFVGKLTASIGAEDLREYFSRFGPITDVYIPRVSALPFC